MLNYVFRDYLIEDKIVWNYYKTIINPATSTLHITKRIHTVLTIMEMITNLPI